MMNKNTVWTNTGFGVYRDDFESASAAKDYVNGIIHAMMICCWLDIVNDKLWRVNDEFVTERIQFSNGKTIYLRYKF